jgi:hypothetical protein
MELPEELEWIKEISSMIFTKIKYSKVVFNIQYDLP